MAEIVLPNAVDAASTPVSCGNRAATACSWFGRSAPVNAIGIGAPVVRQSSTVTAIPTDSAGRGKIALIGEVRPLADVDRLHQLRNQKIDIGIALAMTVGRHVDRHAVDGNREVRAVVEIEAAEKILVGFAFA